MRPLTEKKQKRSSKSSPTTSARTSSTSSTAPTTRMSFACTETASTTSPSPRCGSPSPSHVLTSCLSARVLGKFSKTGKFRLHVTALDYMAQHAKYKVWIKPNGELPFLYGNHVVKAHLGRITDDTPEHAGVVVLSMSNTPLGSE